MSQLTVNGQTYEILADPNTPILWLVRDVIGLKGAKYGCGISNCGACTMLVGGTPMHTCQLTMADINGAAIITIEGLEAIAGPALQNAWVAQQVPQCGFCQPGQLMQASALVANGATPSDAQINTAMTNLCICGTYSRIRAAIHAAAGG